MRKEFIPSEYWIITGKGDGHLYGLYRGATQGAAIRAMLLEAGCYDSPEMDAWCVSRPTKLDAETLCPWAAAIKEAEGGYWCFESIEEAEEWSRQV